eukprot:gene18509-25010_t
MPSIRNLKFVYANSQVHPRTLDPVAEKEALLSQAAKLESQLLESNASRDKLALEVLELKERLQFAEDQAAKDQALPTALVIEDDHVLFEVVALKVGDQPKDVMVEVWTKHSKRFQEMGGALIKQLDGDQEKNKKRWANICAVGKSASKALQGASFVGSAFGFEGVFFGQLEDAFLNCREVIYLSLEIFLMLELFSKIGKNRGFKDGYWSKSAGRLHVQMLMRALKIAKAATNAIVDQGVCQGTAMAGANRRSIEEASENLQSARRNFCEALITKTVLKLEARLATNAKHERNAKQERDAKQERNAKHERDAKHERNAKQERAADDLIFKGPTKSMLHKSPQTEPAGGHGDEYEDANYLQGGPECLTYTVTTKRNHSLCALQGAAADVTVQMGI